MKIYCKIFVQNNIKLMSYFVTCQKSTGTTKTIYFSGLIINSQIKKKILSRSSKLKCQIIYKNSFRNIKIFFFFKN